MRKGKPGGEFCAIYNWAIRRAEKQRAMRLVLSLLISVCIKISLKETFTSSV